MQRIYSIILFFLLWVSLPLQAQDSGSDSLKSSSKSYIHMLHTDVTRFDKEVNPDAWILVGDVRFRRDSMYMYCDSAHYYRKNNSFQAFGNVRMEQGDTLFLFGDYLDYDGDTNLARVRRNVRLMDKNTVLETDSLDFDRNVNLGYFYEYGELYDGESTLVSYYGEYCIDTKEAVFTDDVSLEHPRFRLLSDTLYYNTATKIATIVGPTNIYSGSNEVYSEHGRYNTSNGHAFLLDRSILYNGSKDITADSMFYDSRAGYSEAFGNILYTDNYNKNLLRGGYAYYSEVLDSAFVTAKATVVDFSQKDSLYLHADTIWAISYNAGTDSLYRQVRAYNKVRAWGEKVQAVCDSLTFDSRDTCVTMYKDPIIWNDKAQLLGEVVKIYMDSASIKWVHVINQTLYAEPLDSAIYNQIKGKEMKFFFRDGKLSEMQAIGGVGIVFYPLDNDSTFVGMNTTEAGKAIAFVVEGEMNKVVVPNESKGVFYPMGQRPVEKRFLENFAWFDYVRPKDKEDIYNWRGNEAGLSLKVFRRDTNTYSLMSVKRSSTA